MGSPLRLYPLAGSGVFPDSGFGSIRAYYVSACLPRAREHVDPDARTRIPSRSPSRLSRETGTPPEQERAKHHNGGRTRYTGSCPHYAAAHVESDISSMTS